MTQHLPGSEITDPPIGTPLYALDLRNCWQVEGVMDGGATLFLPGLVVNAWAWARQHYAGKKSLAFSSGTKLPQEYIDIGPLEPVNAWLSPSPGTSDVVSIRNALGSIEIAKRQLTNTSPRFPTVDAIAKTLRNDLRETAESQLLTVNDLIANSPCQLWVAFKSYRSQLVAAAMLSRFIVTESKDVPPMLEPVVKDFHGTEGTHPPSHWTSGLFIGNDGELFQSAGE